MITLTEEQAQQIEEALKGSGSVHALSIFYAARAQADHIADADKMVREPVAVVDANDDGYWADILPDRSVKVGQKLYAAPIEPMKPEPVAWLIPGSITGDKKLAEANGDYATPLYAAPVQPVKQEELNWGANKFMPHEQLVKQEPVAFMFKVKRATAASTVLDEFAALDYFPQDGEEIVSKEPLIYAAPVQPVKQEPVVTERQFKLAMKQWEDWKAYALELQEKLVKHEGGSPMILNTAPVQPVQEPVAFVPEVESGAQLMCEVAEWNKQHLTPLYREPVDAKAIRAEALEEAAKWLKESGLIGSNDCAAAIRNLK